MEKIKKLPSRIRRRMLQNEYQDDLTLTLKNTEDIEQANVLIPYPIKSINYSKKMANRFLATWNHVKDDFIKKYNLIINDDLIGKEISSLLEYLQVNTGKAKADLIEEIDTWEDFKRNGFKMDEEYH